MRFKSRSRALVGAATAGLLGLAGLALTAAPAQAEPADIVRVAGADRYSTAAEAATQAYPAGSANVVLASGEKFPDALAGGGLAGSLDAPIVLSTEDSVPQATLDALEELGADNVTILGGTSAISASAEAALEALGYTVDRVGGADRFETAALIADELGGDTAVLANGLRFPDALAISPGAHALGLPLVLTTADDLHEDAAAFLGDATVENVIIVGGTAVVSEDIEEALEADGKTVTRLAGGDRYTTSHAIADFHVTQGFNLDGLVLATGEKFPDALAGGPFASQMGHPMVLTQSTVLTPSTQAYIEANAATIDTIYVLGGTVAISDAVATAAAAAADEGTVASATIRPELLSAQIVETVTAGNATPTKPAGTYVRYTFDEAVGSTTGQPNVYTNFKVYNSDASGPVLGTDGVTEAGGTSVLVRFATINTATLAAPLTVATVVQNAVFDAAGNGNPEGAAAIGSAATTTLTAGVTAAPDLVSVSGFRQAAAVGSTAVDFVFDEAATVLLTGGFSLVTTSNTVAACTASTTPASTAPSGGTVPGGSGTTTITVTCTNPPATGDPGGVPLSAANVARGVVDLNAVADSGGVNNPMQSADVGNGGNSAGPDLVSATFVQGTTNDSAIFNFDEAIGTVGTSTLFNVYSSSGAQVESGGTPTISTTDPRQVLVTFGPTVLDSAVGASVDPAAVTALAGGAANEKDEVGVTNTNASSVQPGFTSAPDLVSVGLVPTNGFTPAVAQYTFDQDVATGPVDTSFVLYLADGTRLVSDACARGTTSPTTDSGASSAVVTCTFTATNAQVINAVLGTVLEDAVVAETGGNGNPEGDAITSGGTGTPAS